MISSAGPGSTPLAGIRRPRTSSNKRRAPQPALEVNQRVQAVASDEAAAPVRKFGRLGPGVFRGGQPDAAGFAELERLDVDTVICLRTRVEADREAAAAGGMRLIELPMPPLGKPSVEQGMQFLSAATDPAHGKVFFHCTHGVDRTGAAAAIYRLAVQGWDLDRALGEMRERGAHWYIQHAKVDFVREFAAAWNELPEAFRLRVLHRDAPGTAPAAAPSGTAS